MSRDTKTDWEIYDLVEHRYKEAYQNNAWFRNIVDVTMHRSKDQQVPTLIDGLAAMSGDLDSLRAEVIRLKELIAEPIIINTKEKK
jgi:hypothetical protein